MLVLGFLVAARAMQHARRRRRRYHRVPSQPVMKPSRVAIKHHVAVPTMPRKRDFTRGDEVCRGFRRPARPSPETAQYRAAFRRDQPPHSRRRPGLAPAITSSHGAAVIASPADYVDPGHAFSNPAPRPPRVRGRHASGQISGIYLMRRSQPGQHTTQ
jgi:hypothetical protein